MLILLISNYKDVDDKGKIWTNRVALSFCLLLVLEVFWKERAGVELLLCGDVCKSKASAGLSGTPSILMSFVSVVVELKQIRETNTAQH